MIVGRSAATALETEPYVDTPAASSVTTTASSVATVSALATVADDNIVTAASLSMPTPTVSAADTSDDAVEASDAELSSSPSYPDHVKQA